MSDVGNTQGRVLYAFNGKTGEPFSFKRIFFLYNTHTHEKVTQVTLEGYCHTYFGNKMVAARKLYLVRFWTTYLLTCFQY